MRYNSYSDEVACGKRVPGEMSDRYADLGGIACMRTAGHDGECEGMMGHAGQLDGVRWCCRVALATEHAEWCPSLQVCALDHDPGDEDNT